MMEAVARLRRQLARRASKMVVGGSLSSADPLASWLGRVRVALPHEMWPLAGGRPMAPLCQINCGELPFCPEALADIALITVFVDLEEFPYSHTDARGNADPIKENDDRWLLRAYQHTDGLMPIPEPTGRHPLRPVPVRWEAVEDDYPAREDFYDFAGLPYPPMSDFLDHFLKQFPAELLDSYVEIFEPYCCSKVGGWPALIQGRIFHEHPARPAYVFQVAEEDKANLHWVDAGIAYFARGTCTARDEWFA